MRYQDLPDPMFEDQQSYIAAAADLDQYREEHDRDLAGEDRVRDFTPVDVGLGSGLSSLPASGSESSRASRAGGSSEDARSGHADRVVALHSWRAPGLICGSAPPPPPDDFDPKEAA